MVRRLEEGRRWPSCERRTQGERWRRLWEGERVRSWGFGRERREPRVFSLNTQKNCRKCHYNPKFLPQSLTTRVNCTEAQSRTKLRDLAHKMLTVFLRNSNFPNFDLSSIIMRLQTISPSDLRTDCAGAFNTAGPLNPRFCFA